MLCNIIGCGQTASHWDGSGLSIGVNDAWKFGKPTNYLLLANRPLSFSSDRLQTIINSKPEKFYCDKKDWEEWFPDWIKIRLKPWYGSYFKENFYYSNTSPFIAITLAANIGATKIILWGVDFQDHHKFNGGNPETKREIERYQELITELRAQGIETYLGAPGSALESFLPIYQTIYESKL
jgi:hypothetical protein